MKHCGFGTDYIRPDHTYSMLSRYNGIGSLKMSIGNAHNHQRTSNPYIMSEVTRMDIAGHRNDTTDSTYADLPSECLPTKNAVLTRKTGKQNHPNTDTNDLKANAQFNLSRKPWKGRKANHEPIHTIEQNVAANGRQQKCIPKITSTNSIYSGTSTISNSSLQEYDDNELNTTELARYMRKINHDIHHDAK